MKLRLAPECMQHIIIRTLDLYAGIAEAGYVNKSLDYAIKEKMERNTHRPKKHGVRF